MKDTDSKLRETYLKKMGDRLTEERKRLNLNAVYTYEQLNIHQHTYHNYETGKRDIPSFLLNKLCNMGFDVMYVVTGVHTKENETPSKPIEKTNTTRLINLSETYDKDNPNPSDRILSAMKTVEDALINTGATPRDDYNYKDLLEMIKHQPWLK